MYSPLPNVYDGGRAGAAAEEPPIGFPVRSCLGSLGGSFIGCQFAECQAAATTSKQGVKPVVLVLWTSFFFFFSGYISWGLVRCVQVSTVQHQNVSAGRLLHALTPVHAMHQPVRFWSEQSCVASLTELAWKVDHR